MEGRIIFWTGAKYLDLKKTALAQLANYPTKIPYRVHQLNKGLPPLETGDVCVAMGAKALSKLQQMGLAPKGRTVTSLREKPIPFGNGHILITYDPGISSIDYSKYVDMQIDVSLAVRMCLTGKAEPELGNYRIVEDFDDLINEVDRRYERNGKPVPLTYDLETVGLDEYNEEAWIVSISFSIDAGMADMMYFKTINNQPTELQLIQIKWLLSSNKIATRGANGKYDRRWLKKKWGLDNPNYKMDTTIVGSLLDENRSNSLNTHAKIYTSMGGYDDPLNQKYDKGAMQNIPLEDFVPYAGGDTDATYRVARETKRLLLAKPRLARFYVNLLHPASLTLQDMEEVGILIDTQYFMDLQHKLTMDLRAVEQEALKLLPNRLRIKHQSNPALTRAALIKDYMFDKRGLGLKPLMLTGKKEEPSTAKEHLLLFMDRPEASAFLTLYKEYTAIAKTLNTYVTGFLKHLRPDGRFHPTGILYKGDYGGTGDSGTVTGRLAFKDPAVQCLEGSMRVLTDRGWIGIRQLVEEYEEGKSFKVVTHTGKMKSVVGVYRNGVKPVLTCSFEQGKLLTSTGNHPYLTDRGWVRADELKVGDTCYALKGKWFRPSDTELYQPNLLQLGINEEQMQQPNLQRLRELRRQGYQAVRALEPVPELFGGHGGEAGEGVFDRPYRQQRGLHTGELPVVERSEASLEPQKLKANSIQGKDADRGGMGEGVWDQPGQTPLSVDRFGTVYGGSLDEGDLLECGLYEACRVESITADGQCETFDITVQESHSFVAEGIVVHNTIPKHTKYAKVLRRGYIAPPGYVIVNWDYSQGELKITACLANEERMLQVYRDGIDLHMVTGGGINGYSIEDMLKMETTDPELFGTLRQGGKAGNFGLIYGMQAEGYQTYAHDTYGVDITMLEAKSQRNAFFALYPGLLDWHDEYQSFARRWGFVESPLGRIRHLPLISSPDRSVSSKAERQAINSPVQATLSDLTQYTLVLFKENYGIQPGCQFFLTTHDSLSAYVREDEVDIWTPRVANIMETLPLQKVFGWAPQIPFTADAEVGPNLADMKKVARSW